MISIYELEKTFFEFMFFDAYFYDFLNDNFMIFFMPRFMIF